MERREYTRYGVRVPVAFRWVDADGVQRQARGITRDISSKGIFICADSQPPEHAEVQVKVNFSLVHETAKGLVLHARSLVLRVDAAPDPGADCGFAILNRSYRLAQGHKSSKGYGLN